MGVCLSGGNQQLFPWGNSTAQNGKYAESGLKNRSRWVFPPNPWGFYDMHGNVWEWTADPIFSPINRGVRMDPQGPSTGSKLSTEAVPEGWCF